MSNDGPIRVCVVGAESTGTTTLSRDLAAHYLTVWVPEYGRLYTERLQEQGDARLEEAILGGGEEARS